VEQTLPRENSITGGVIWKTLLSFFFPILLGTFFQQLYNTADAVIVGRYVGKEALAAVGGSTSTLINLLVGLFVGISSGAAVIISQLYGAWDTEGTQKAVHTSMAFAITGGALLMVVGWVMAPAALRAMNTPEEVLPYSLTYMRVYFLGMIFNLVYNMGAGILRAVGDSRRPLYFLIASCLGNILLDIILVVYIPLGVLGVALGTLASQLISAVLVYLSLSRTTHIYHLNRKKIAFDGPMLWRIVVIGLPAGLQSVMYSISNIIIQSSINGFGTNAAAAWTAYSKIDGFFWMIMSAFGVAITTFSGQNFGAGQYDRIRKSVKVCLAMSAGTAVFLSTTLFFLGSFVYRLFTSDPEVIQEGMVILRLLVPFYITYIAIEILSGAMRGTGDSIIPMIITCVGICVLRAVWIMVAVPYWRDIRNICLSYPITWSVTSIFFTIYYLQGGWLRRRIAKAQASQEEKAA
jgi:putative MATE family efflux protein